MPGMPRSVEAWLAGWTEMLSHRVALDADSELAAVSRLSLIALGCRSPVMLMQATLHR